MRTAFMPMFLTGLLATTTATVTATAQAAPASAAPDLSDLLREKGLAAAQADLAGRGDATPDTAMALAAVSFLRGIERAYQARWRIGENAPLGQMLGLPVLTADLPQNPAPQPLEPDFLNRLAQGLIDDMTATRKALDGVDDSAALTLRPDAIWFDINQNGQPDTAEGLAAFMPAQFGIPLAAATPQPDGSDQGNGGQGSADQGDSAAAPVVRFDAADAEWLRAYTHMLSGFAEFLLAFDPEAALSMRIATQQALADQWRGAMTGDGTAGDGRAVLTHEADKFGPLADDIATILSLLRHDPDPARLHAARQHLRDMIAANRRFWDKLGAETDNDREWIPNDRQQAALGFELPKGTGPAWQAVLTEAGSVLDGKLLVPFWRFAPDHGINIAKWFENPSALDPVGWVQGASALPYAEKGPLSRADTLAQFARMFDGPAGLYMILLN